MGSPIMRKNGKLILLNKQLNNLKVIANFSEMVNLVYRKYFSPKYYCFVYYTV